MSDYSRAYSKGYWAGSRCHWPAHQPPMPPDALCRALMEAARQLRDGVDAELATFGEDDEITAKLGPLVDELDAVFTRVSDWLRCEAGPTDAKE